MAKRNPITRRLPIRKTVGTVSKKERTKGDQSPSEPPKARRPTINNQITHHYEGKRVPHHDASQWDYGKEQDTPGTKSGARQLTKTL